LCKYCEQVSHKPDDCHLFSAPKPQLILHGISDEKLMFFECPITKSYRPKLESTRLGLLLVTGGELSIPGIIAQLQRLVPIENFTWECRQVGHNVFKVTFPDKEEIERLARFGSFHVPNSSIKLDFEQCISSMEPTSKLPEIWILMSGIPQRRIGDFLAMWSLGTLFGKTLKVDMKFTREKGVLRILVGCLDFRRIPAKERIFIADGFYDICFEVEAQRGLVSSMEVNPGEDHSDHDGHGNNDDSTSENQKNLNAMETDVAHNRHELDGSKNNASIGPDINKLAGDFSSGVKFSPRVKLMMEQSKKEIAFFINSLVPAAATAEDQLFVAAASGDVDCMETSAGVGKLVAAAKTMLSVAAAAEALPPAVASPPASPRSATDAGAEYFLSTVQPAEAQGTPTFTTGAGVTATPVVVETLPFPSAGCAAGVVFSAVTSSPSSHAAFDPIGPKVDGPSFTSPTKDSFRASSESSETFLYGQKKDASPFIDAKKTAPLSPSTRNNGSSSSKPSEAPPAGYEKEMLW
jgi:hypothetical protein